MRPQRARRRAACVAALLGGVVGLITGTAPSGADGNEAPGAPLAARSISAGNLHTCAILDGGIVKCWGSNNDGELGQGDTDGRGDDPDELGSDLAPVALGAGRTATAITAPHNQTCALLDNGTVKCWGYNFYGQLGQGDTAKRGDSPNEMGDNLPPVALGAGRTAQAVTGGQLHTCALLDNGTVKCWGYNLLGTLGVGDTTTRGDGPGEMGNALPAVSLGPGRTATAIASGSHHTCALLDDGSVKCWGYNGFGQAGAGDTVLRGDGPGEMGANLPAVALGPGRTATAITAGESHTCALLDNGTIKCWGANTYGQLGLGDTSNRGDGPGEMGANLPAVALGAGRSARSVAAGSDHTCARLDNGAVKCWGYNARGQLGLGDFTYRGDGPGEMGDALPPVALGTGRTATAVTGGEDYTCARLDDGAMKCWGHNLLGQLGVGDTANRGDGPGEMGDALPAAEDLGTGGLTEFRVDGAIRRSTGTTYLGGGTYNTTGAGQRLTTNVRRGRSTSFFVRFENDAAITDSIRVRGPASSTRFTIRYFVGATDVTRSVVAGTRQFTSVAPGQSRIVKVTVTVRAGTPVNTVRSLLVRGTSVGDPTRVDVVDARVKAIA